MKTGNIVLIIVVIVVAIFLILKFEKCTSKTTSEAEQTNLVDALNDSIRFYKGADSISKATIQVLRTENIKTFTDLQIKDEEVRGLQKAVSEYKNKLKAGSSVTNTLLETLVQNTAPTTITKTDTITKDNYIEVWPEYSKDFEDKWITTEIRMNKDSSFLSLKSRDSLTIVIGIDKKKPFAEITSYSPYTEVKKLRTYQVSLPPPKKFGIGIQAGYGFSEGLKPRPYVGIGVSYNFIRF